MGIYEDLVRLVGYKAGKTEVRDVRVGTTWTAVRTDRTGLSLTYTLPRDEIENSGELIGKSASHLLEFAKTFNFLKLTVGLATINSLITPPENLEKINILEFIKENATGKKVVFVGHFCGVEEIKPVAKELIVLERNPQEGDLPDTASEYVIPEADIVAITGSTFANKTIERLLQLSKGLTIVFGPSTPLSDILFDYGADIIGGSIIKNEKYIIEAVSQGAHLNNFKKHLEYVVMRKK